LKVKKMSGELFKKSVRQDLKEVVQTLHEQNLFDKQPTWEAMVPFQTVQESTSICRIQRDFSLG